MNPVNLEPKQLWCEIENINDKFKCYNDWVGYIKTSTDWITNPTKLSINAIKQFCVDEKMSNIVQEKLFEQNSFLLKINSGQLRNSPNVNGYFNFVNGEMWQKLDEIKITLPEGLDEKKYAIQILEFKRYILTNEINITRENFVLLSYFADYYVLTDLTKQLKEYSSCVEKGNYVELVYALPFFNEALNAKLPPSLIWSFLVNAIDSTSETQINESFEKGLISHEAHHFLTLANTMQDTVRFLVNNNQNTLEFGYNEDDLPKLKEFDERFIITSLMSNNISQKMFECFPKLRCLQLSALQMDSLEISGVGLQKISIESCNNLEELELDCEEIDVSSCCNLKSITAKKAKKIDIGNCPHLSNIDAPGAVIEKYSV